MECNRFISQSYPMNNKRKIIGKAVLEFQERYGNMQWYTKILFDDSDVWIHYKIKIPEAIYGEMAKMLRQMYKYTVPQSESEAHKYVDCVMQALHNVSHHPKWIQIIAAPLIDIAKALSNKE